MKRCTLCGTTDQSRFPNNTNANHTTYCLRCSEKYRKSSGKLAQQRRNRQIRKGLA